MDTPRTDSFIRSQVVVEFNPADFTSTEALVRATTRVRDLMVGYAEFARGLEEELNRSVPPEWSGELRDEVSVLRAAVRECAGWIERYGPLVPALSNFPTGWQQVAAAARAAAGEEQVQG